MSSSSTRNLIVTAIASSGTLTITAAGNFTLVQNGVDVITSRAVGALANTLYLKAGNVGIGTAADPATRLHITNGLGTTNGITIGKDLGLGGNVPFQVVHTVTNIVFERRVAGAALCPEVILSKTRGDFDNPAAVADGNCLGKYKFNGHDGTDSLTTAASIEGYADDTVSGNVVPGKVILKTADAAGALTERMSINSAGLFTLAATAAFTPSSVAEITAGGGITVTNEFMKIKGSGGAVDITANPQIVAGTNGQQVTLMGQSDTDYVTLDDGAGLHLHGQATIGDKDAITLRYDSTDSEWQEISRNFELTSESWSFSSPQGATGTFDVDGWYDFGATDNDFNPTINFGTANKSEAAHFFLVQAAGGVGGTDTVIRITGATIDDTGTRQAGQTVDITVDDAGAAGTYYETTEKWLGQIAIVKLSGPDLLMNYGFTKYWDNNNNDFIIKGLEATWLGGANDTDTDIILRHHKTAGWVYNNGAPPTPPAALAQMTVDHDTDSETVKDEQHAWKRSDLNTSITGSGSEGTIIELVTGANLSIERGTFLLKIRRD